MQVGRGDVGEVDLPDHAHAELPCSGARATEVLEIEDDHVAAVAAVAIDVPPRRGAILRRRDDLEEAVTEREDGVGEPEEADAGVVEGLAEAEHGAQRARHRLEVAGGEHRLTKPHS